MNNSPLLQLNNVSKSYGSKIVVDKLSLSIQSGETFCLLGANGAGKSTTVKLILGLIHPDEVRILIGGNQ